MIDRICPYCSKKFKTWQARLRQGKGIFCSMQCAAKYHRDHNDGGAVCLFKPGHPTSNTGRTHFTTEKLKGKSHSPEHTRKVASALTGVHRPERMGSNSSNWKGGITKENKLARTSADFINWRKKVFENDDYTCQICARRGGVLHAHHIRMFSRYPWLRFEVSNGVTVCKDCHGIADAAARIVSTLEEVGL